MTQSESPKSSSSSSPSSVLNVEGKRVLEDVGDPKCPDPIPGFQICPCCPYSKADFVDYVDYGKYESAESKYYGEMLGGVMISYYLFPLIQEMADKSDDKTLVVSNITRDIRDKAKFLALFHPYGKVESAKLLPCHSEKDILGDIGFVTFESKKDAQQAMSLLRIEALVPLPPTENTK
ncbi:hypothetical protein P8452_02776 [Trifolium repens]|nr:hypothetical protein P8452_02776 [Trifolium repens]